MSTLLEISEDLLAFKALMDECDGEITPDVDQALEAWFAELDRSSLAKLDNYAAFVRELQLRIAARKEEKERLEKRIKVDTDTMDWLKERMKQFFEVQGLKTKETRRFKLTVCGNGGLTPMETPEHPETLPQQYQRIEVKANKDLIRKALECGQAVPGAKLLPRGTHLRIS